MPRCRRVFGVTVALRAAPLLAALGACLATGVVAQPRLHEPTRTVYRCETGGKVTYSDEPCLGARRVDVTPTRGLDASMGRTRTGADVQREREREMWAQALRPLTGESAEQFELRRRRLALAPTAKVECADLDRRLPRQEAAERAAAGADRAELQAELLHLRQRQRALRC